MMKFANTLVNFCKPYGVGIPHRPTAMSREAIPVDENDVDINRAKCVAFFEYARAFVDERIDAAIDDFVRGNLPLWDSRFCSTFANEIGDRRIGMGIAILVILEPTGPSFLPQPPNFTQAVAGNRLANARFLQMTILLADAPADIQARKVSHSERSHSHSEFIECIVHCLDARAFLDQENGFAHIRMKHAVADKTAAIPDQNTDLPKLFGELHARGNHLFAGLLPTDDLE